MSDYQNRDVQIRKGQAYNLAIGDAQTADRMYDIKYIAERFMFHYQMASNFQNLSLEDIAHISESETIREKLLELEKLMENRNV